VVCWRLPIIVLQGAKYWLRVNRHLEQEDFPLYGFFPGTQLRPTPPVVYFGAGAWLSSRNRSSSALLEPTNGRRAGRALRFVANRPLRGPAPINLQQATLLASGKFRRNLSRTVGLYLPCKRKGYFS
jgi:hypothetical protein